MANLDITFRSQSLTRPTTFHLIWPNDVPPDMKAQNPHYGRPCKTLFLLHGYTAGYKEWPSCSPIWELAMKYNLAVVCPDGGISFYLDGKRRRDGLVPLCKRRITHLSAAKLRLGGRP